MCHGWCPSGYARRYALVDQTVTGLPVEPDSSLPGHAQAPDTMVELTIRTAGAVRHAPRLLRAWLTATETCVRDETGMLLWLATPTEVAWLYDGQLVTSPALNDRDPAELAPWEPATEVAALRTVESATLWLGTDVEPIPRADGTSLNGRAVTWFDLPRSPTRNLEIAQDSETGFVVHISGTDPTYGNLLVEATAIAVLPRDEARFQARLQL
jgi:hypothetical protein